MEKKLITLLEASRMTPFDANYLGLLIRKKKLFAVKKNGKWYTTKEAIKKYMAVNARKETVMEAYRQRFDRAFFPGVIVSLILFIGAFFGFVFAENSAKSNVSSSDTYVVSPMYTNNFQDGFIVSSPDNKPVFAARENESVLPTEAFSQ